MEKIKTFVVGPCRREHGLNRAAEIVRAGGVVVFPTETVYGLGAHPMRPDAVRKLYDFKVREYGKPFQLLIDDRESASRRVARIPAAAWRLMTEFWPGPLTVILPAVAGGTVGLRVPDHPIAIRLIQLCGGALLATSANRSGMPETTDFISAHRIFDGLADVAVDGGECSRRVASTVVDCTSGHPVVVREGAISRADVMRVAGGKQETAKVRGAKREVKTEPRA